MCPLSITLDTVSIDSVLYPAKHRVFSETKGMVHPLTSFAKTLTSPIPRTFVLPPSGWFLTVVSGSLRQSNQFLFTTIGCVLPQSTTRSCFATPLVALSDFRLETKLPGVVSLAFFTQAGTRCAFCFQ